jgi:hypothetical protein
MSMTTPDTTIAIAAVPTAEDPATRALKIKTTRLTTPEKICAISKCRVLEILYAK